MADTYSLFPRNYSSPQMYESLDGDAMSFPRSVAGINNRFRIPRSVTNINNRLSIPGSIGEIPALDHLPELDIFSRRDNYVERSKNVFKILLDVFNFKPQEIEAKLVGDLLVVHVKHEEKYDEHGSVFRDFTRRFKIPAEVDTSTMKCFYYKNGLLAIKALMKPKLSAEVGMIIPLERGQSIGAKDIMHSETSNPHAAELLNIKRASAATQ